MICIDDLKKLVDSELGKKRREHTYGVAETAKELAKIYGENPDDAEYAALFHDLYKGKTTDEMNELVKEWGLADKYIDNRSLAHGKLAACAMKNLYGVNDQKLIDAVSYHTTGRANMSKLEKIIYLADGIEPNRDYPGVEKNREIAKKSLNLGCLIGIEEVIKKLKKQGETEKTIDKDTIEARQYLINELKRRTCMKQTEVKEIANFIADFLSEKKAEDVDIIDISEKSAFADYFINATGGSERQVASLVEDVEDKLAEKNLFPKSIEGKNGKGWILMDYGDFIVNIFSEEMRENYSLEKIWGDCEITTIDD